MGCVPNRLTLGIDEAGRGPILGPMVMAAVGLESPMAAALTRAGLADSKSYGAGDNAREMRAELAARILGRAIYVRVAVLDVSVIDRRVARGELNLLEREVAADFIDEAPSCHRIVCDGKTMFSPLAVRFPGLEARNNGESVHAAVAAASVIAKHRRDQIFAAIASRYSSEFGVIGGGGYMNARTREFLRNYVTRYRRLPPEARRSWPHTYLSDILGDNYDPYGELSEPRPGQMRLC